MKKIDILKEMARVIDVEIEALKSVRSNLGSQFEDAVRMIGGAKGQVVVTGIGKSGIIANKIAATFRSTGTQAIFLHASEALHGDIGSVGRHDVMIAIGKSGETNELNDLLRFVKKSGARVISITSNASSAMAKLSDIVLDLNVHHEACPLNLAPTASTTAALALGDALAVALLDARGFRSDDFAQHHPGGTLGRRLLVHVADIMRTGDRLPRNSPDALLPAAIVEMTRKGIGMTCIVDDKDKLLGIFTDGDLRRTLEKHDMIKNLRVADVMTRNPRSIAPERLAAEAAQILEKQSLGGRLVVLSPEGRLVGALTFHDLLAAGVV